MSRKIDWPITRTIHPYLEEVNLTGMLGLDQPNVPSSLSEILETGPHLRKYFLSPKACKGILRRAERRNRTLPPPLKEALEKTILMFEHETMDSSSPTSLEPSEEDQVIEDGATT